MTKIFLDGSDLGEIDALLERMGSYDGQTTNPSNFVQALKNNDGTQVTFSKDELLLQYKNRVVEISNKLPNGSISIEVYADANTGAQKMIDQARVMNAWISNAHIKLPITTQGLKAAETLVKEGVRVNMTLCFSQEQAAAVYAATKGAKPGDVYISPFIGRINDKGKNGIDLVKNILKMYKGGDGHVMVLAASIRNGEQLSEAVSVGSDITTSYLKAIEEWLDAGKPTKDPDTFDHSDLLPITYKDFDLELPYENFDISHEMTDDGLKRFAGDWNEIISK